MLDEIYAKIEETINVYKYSKDRIISDYNSEKNAVKDYKGRELFELIQNSDDAQAKKVYIDLDIKEQTLTISNDGKPFSLKGYSSIFLHHNSAKKSEEFIGNKGLGFRSILSWADEITIKSNGFALVFSKEISNKILHEKIDIDPSIKAATLVFPKVINECTCEKPWVTQVIIKFNRSSLNDIKKQLLELNDTKYLLEFLNNIEELYINENVIKKDNDKCYIFKSKKEQFPDTASFITEEDIYKKYEIKAIYSEMDDFTKEPLYSYLPTKVRLYLPVLIHATFELDSARNYIPATDKNKYIFDQIITYLKEIVIDYTQNECNWIPYELLNYKQEAIEIEKDFYFYSKIKILQKSLKIIPCLDNEYRTIDKAIFLEKELTEYLDKLQTEYHIELPSSFNRVAKANSYNLSSENEILLEDISKLSNNILGHKNEIEIRTSLIYLLKDKLISLLPENLENYNEYSLFIDNNNTVIKYNQRIFTHKTLKEELVVPSFVNITFLSSKLLNSLLTKYECNDDDYYRQLQRILKDIAQIYTYEPVPIIEQIISDTRTVIKKNKEYALSNIKEMIKVISKIWSPNTAAIRVSVPLISDDNRIISTDSGIFFNSSYLNGYMTEFLCKDYVKNTNQNFILNKEEWAGCCEASNIEEFFKWLGVKETIEPELFKNNLENIINNFSLEQTILYFSKNIGLLYEDNLNLKEIICPHYHLNNFVINCKNLPFINIDFKLDKKLLFKIFDIEEYTINNILKELGAAETIEDLSSYELGEIIKNKLPVYDTDGHYAQLLYEQLIETNKANGDNYHLPRCKLFSKNKQNYIDSDKLYYYDNRSLPKNIIQSYPLIDIPRRRGSKQIKNIFGVKTFDEIEIKVVEKKEIKSLTKEFMAYFKQLRPIFVAYRALGSDKNVEEAINEQYKKICDVKIELCEKISYQKDLVPQIVDDFEFINEQNNKNKYYIKMPDDIVNLNDLYTNNEYRIKIGEFISEIISITFGLNDGDRYAAIFKDFDIQYSEKMFEENYPLKILMLAKNKEGLSCPKENFWRRLHKVTKQTISFEEWYYKKSLKNKWDFDYENYNDIMDELLDDYEINDKKQFFDNLDTVNFKNYNIQKYKNIYENLYENEFIPILWTNCQNDKKNFDNYKTQCNWSKIINQFEKYIPVNQYEQNYEEQIWKYVSSLNLGIKKKSDKSKTKEEIEYIYNRNREKYKDYIDNINGNDNLASILFFEDTSEIDQFCSNIVNKKNMDKEISPDEELKPLTEIKDYIPKYKFDPKKNKQKASHHSFSSDKLKKQIGNMHEKMAKEELEKKYVKVEQVNNDSLGYDLKCYDDKNNVFYYEIKTLSGNGFFLTANEYETCKKQNEYLQTYFIFLFIDNSHYTIIKDIDTKCLKKDDTYFMILK